MNIFRIVSFIMKKFKVIFLLIMERINRQAVTKIGGMKFSAPTKLCVWRSKTMFKKEPETIKWIDTFGENEIFWDIGANVGIYTIYAAFIKNIRVFSFEPSPFNFSVLSKNIYLNNMSSNISAFCLAFTDNTAIDYLNLKSINAGAAHTSFQNTMNEFGENFVPEYSQSTLGFSISDFIRIFDLAVPNHIKIDVDGAEKIVMDGAASILGNINVRSILIEMNSKLKTDERVIFNNIISNGFYFERSDHPDGDKRLSNYIFRRN